jgi:type II secretory ATPase GspE/PulE/Tfp pilus assembly ATPase PilB-like protein
VPASVNIIIAQRLVKKLCECKTKITKKDLDKDTLSNIEHAISITDKKELEERV